MKKKKNNIEKKLKIVSYFIIVIIFIITSIHYDLVFNKINFTTEFFYKEPNSIKGIEKTFLGKFHGSFKGGFFLEYNKKIIPLQYEKKIEPPRYGNMAVYGLIHENGYIEVKGVHNYDYNYIIYFISLITGIFVVILFFKEWRITKRGFESA